MVYDESMPVWHESPVPRAAPIDFEQLRRFFAVAQARSFTAAARRLHIAQPAVSRSVSALEDDLGKKLIERTSRRFALTAAGERLHAECAALFERVDALRGLVAEQEVDVHGALRLGATEPVAAGLLPRALTALVARHGRLHPFVVVAPTHDLVARLVARDLDLVLGFNAPRAANVVSRTIATFRFNVMVAPSRVDDPRTCETFLGSREVEDERERTFPVLTAWRARWPATRIRASTNSIGAHVALVRAGTGVSILPELAVHEDVAAGRMVRAPGMPDFEFPLLAVRRKGEVTAPVAAFSSALAEVLPYAPGFVG